MDETPVTRDHLSENLSFLVSLLLLTFRLRLLAFAWPASGLDKTFLIAFSWPSCEAFVLVCFVYSSLRGLLHLSNHTYKQSQSIERWHVLTREMLDSNTWENKNRIAPLHESNLQRDCFSGNLTNFVCTTALYEMFSPLPLFQGEKPRKLELSV